MASEAQRVPTYPVWVGNLKDTVREKDLKRVFAKVGQVANCRVMVDESGNSKCFGYVNYYTEEEAERAASVKQGSKISGVAIKTKGPKVLSRQGHFNTSLPRPDGLNFRPLTDCSFFIMGKKCKKAGTCPYRHSEAARSSPVTCPQWVERNCLDVNCPYRHPGGKEKKGDLDAEVVSGSGLELIKCGGRCGQSSCAAHFASKEDLSQHIKINRLLQCRHCRAIFFTDVEYREHKMSCRARMNSGSTDLSSDSVDIEEFTDTESDSDSTDSESDEETPANQFSSSSGAGQLPAQLRKAVDPIHRSASANVIISSKKQFPHQERDRRSSESGTKTKGELATSTKYSSPPRTRKSRLDSNKKSSSAGTSSNKASDLYGIATADADSGGLLYPGIGGYGMAYDNSVIMEYGDSDSDDSDYGDDDGVDISPSEMTRLLSLNDQDMYEGEESEEEEEEEGEGEGIQFSGHTVQGENGVKKARHGQPTKLGSRKPTDGGGGHGGMVKSPHRVKLEPVGVFWDIENCPVPVDKSAFSLAAKMRRVFFEGKREAEFMCVCDVTKERKEVTDALHNAQVTLVHVNAIAKNAADDKLRQSLRRFAHTYPSPSTVVLISGDVNFSSELTDLRHVHNITIVLVHNPQASQALKVFAHKLIDFYEFLEDVEAPQQPQPSTQPRVVIVSGLPKHMPVAKVNQRLDRLSDNCGGKVLKVDQKTGTAKILFRTPEWANKALKRMSGEDVYGYKVTTALETQPPPHVQQKHGPSHPMRNLSGSSLSNSFPPNLKSPPPAHHPPPPPFMTPRPQRPPLMSPPHPPRPNFHQHPGMFSPTRPTPPLGHFGGPQQPHPRMAQPHPPPQRAPLLKSPPHQGGGRFPPVRPGIPPGQPPSSPAYPQPLPAFTIQAPLHTAPPSKIHGPDGKILVFRIPAVPEVGLDQLNGHVVAIRLEACVKAEHLILWHNLSELQVLMRVDFIQTASAMKEDVIKTLIEKKQLKKELAQKFLERCAESVERVSKLHRLPWEVTSCGWTEDEEEERVVRSKVVALLRRYAPYYWTKWNTFKQKFNEVYASAISEMAIHNACRGAVQILGNPGNSQNQVIIFYELSPLVKVVNNQQVLAQLQKNFIKLLNFQPDKKVKLLDFVRVYKDSGIGALPVSSSGRLLQEVITSTPSVTMMGVKPSNIYVTLGTSDKGAVGPVASTPQNLPGISAAFVNLLVHTTSGAIPLSQFQQEYQTFYHKSFRVSDYLSGTARLRDLLEKCSGIKLIDIPIPSGGTRTIVALDNEKPPSASQAADSAVNSSSRRSPVPDVPGDIASLSAKFRSLLARFPDRRLPLREFQQEYQTYFRHSFRVCDYLSKEDAGLRDLLNACQGIKVMNVMLANGKSEAFVHRSEDVAPPPPSPSKVQKSASSANMNVTSSPSVTPGSASQRTGTEPSVSPTPDTIPADSLELFRQECIDVLSGLPDRRVQLAKFPEAYYKAKGQMFTLARYKAKKIVLLAQAIPNTVRILGEKDNKIMELITDTKKDFEDRVQRMLYGLPNQSITLDRFVVEYEKHSGRKLSSFYGHPKLLKLLESIPDTVRLKGNGPARHIQLQPRCVFAMDMAQLVSFHPDGLPISQVVPSYKTTFGRELVVANLGYPKLIKALESLPNILVICGEGPSRTILPKLGPPAGVVSPPAPPAVLPPLQLFADEIVAILMTTFNQQLSLIQLTARYNTCFRPDQPRVTKEQLLDAIKKLSNFKITESGTTTFVQLAPPSPEHSQEAQPGGASKAKRKVKTSESKEPSETAEVVAQVDTTTEPTVAATVDDKPQATPASPLQNSPNIVKKESIGGPLEHSSVLAKPAAQLVEDGEEGKRLFSETRRMLQLHHEHAMTLTELVERFKRNEDPTLPTAEQLYQLLTKFNTKEGGTGTGGRTTKIMQISYIPSSVGDSVIQLGVADCFQKLSDDLAYLFVFHPTANFSMSVSELESCYAECYGRKLEPAIYAAKTVQKLFTWKQVVKVVQFNSGSGMCQLTQSGRLTALAALLAELLFTRGAECSTLDNLLELYQQHFGVPLQLKHFGVDNIVRLIELPEINEVVELVDVQVREDSYQVKPVLSTHSLLVEQLRYLLTIHDGCVPMEQVESVYTFTFGIQTHISISDLLERNKIIRVAPHVVNVTGNRKWLVWAPTGRPYPNRDRKTSMLPMNKCAAEVSEAGVETTKTAIAERSEALMNEHSTNAMVGADVTEDDSPPVASQLKPHPIFSEPAPTLLGNKQNSTADSDEQKSTETSTAVSVTQVNVENSVSNVGDSAANTNFIESSVDPPSTTSTTTTSASPSQHSITMASISQPSTTTTLANPPQYSITTTSMASPPQTSTTTASLASPSQTKGESSGEVAVGEVTAETYGFLEETLEPELMAELRASGEQHQQREQTLGELLSTQPLSEQAIQVLLHFAKPMSELDLEESDGDSVEELEKQVESDQPVDYLASGMSPDQVLEEMRSLKERSGGYLSPDKMEPFLTYFGELSSRELDRINALEEKEKAKSKKEATKKKRVMAIRFPDKSPAPTVPPSDEDPYEEQRLYSAELLKDKLPAVPDFENMSDSSDDDARPLEREEYIQTLLQRGVPSLTDEEIMRVTQMGKSSVSIDWASLDMDSGMGTDISDLPKPLLSTSETERAAAHQLFDREPFVMDRNSAESKADEWPDLK